MSASKDRNLIFDVGLNEGEDTDFYLKKGFRVVAFEANPDLVASCSELFREAIQNGQLTIVHGAIVPPASLTQGQSRIAFFQNECGSGWGTTRPDWAARNMQAGNPSQMIEVDVVDFSSALREHGIPYYMKVDIEGCDLVCVEALKDFHERPDYLSIESDKTSLRRIRDEIALMSDLGYQSFQAVEQSAVVLQTPPSPAREGRFAPHVFPSGASGLFGAELPGRWRSQVEIIRLYRWIRLGYYLLGDRGILNAGFRGAGTLRRLSRAFLARLVHAAVPGWYDTHARL